MNSFFKLQRKLFNYNIGLVNCIFTLKDVFSVAGPTGATPGLRDPGPAEWQQGDGFLLGPV